MAHLPEHRTPHLTRRGSLAYYLGAWVCGGFFFSVAIFLFAPKYSDFGLTMDMHSFLSVCFLVLFYGWVATLGFAFLLRRMAGVFRWNRAWPWTISGGALTLFLAFTLFFVVGPHISPSGWMRFLGMLFELQGADGTPMTSRNTLAGLAMVLAGMATAYVLFRVDLAFTEPRD